MPTFFIHGRRDEPWRTGDRVTEDEEGYFCVEGRTDDVIISAGYRIGPFEVESALVTDPAVAEAAAVAAPDHVSRPAARWSWSCATVTSPATCWPASCRITPRARPPPHPASSTSPPSCHMLSGKISVPSQTRKLSGMANRLASETSPYLLQHKDNRLRTRYLVGEEGLAGSRDEDWLILLSIGDLGWPLVPRDGARVVHTDVDRTPTNQQFRT